MHADVELEPRAPLRVRPVLHGLRNQRLVRDQVLDAGSSVTISVDDSKFAGWTKLELFDGARKVGERLKGPVEFKVKDLKTGYHAFSVLGADGKGNIRTSNPVLVVVRSKP